MHNLAPVLQVDHIIDNMCYILHLLMSDMLKSTYQMLLMQRMFYFLYNVQM